MTRTGTLTMPCSSFSKGQEMIARMAEPNPLVARDLDEQAIIHSRSRNETAYNAFRELRAELMQLYLELDPYDEVVETLTTRFVSELLGERDPADRLRARWLVRVILSLLTMPGEDEAEERALLEQFLAPALRIPAD